MTTSSVQTGKIPAVAFLLARTVVYATAFIGFLFVYVPGRLLSRAGIASPTTIGPAQIVGIIVTTAGAGLCLWCLANFIQVGRGTPAPFDAPRRLVVRGPYRFVRNPMYIGGGVVLAGVALFYRSRAVLVYAVAFMLVAHTFVVFYEERVLRRRFGEEYELYLRSVRRWLPKIWPRG
jgi:protein-S-isoprenylcysteine O-methyltransferase Ste14